MKTCSRSECGMPVKRRGYCPVHQREYMQAWRAAHPDYMRDYMRVWSAGRYQKKPPRMLACRWCSVEFVAYGRQRWCSKLCRQLDLDSIEAMFRERLHCLRCGKQFVQSRKHKRFCSRLCRIDFHTNARFHRERSNGGEAVSRLAVFERDAWRCALCHRKVDPRLSSMSRMGATLDHIVPISDGGRHVESNLQLAHRACNSRKGARHGQLRLAMIG